MDTARLAPLALVALLLALTLGTTPARALPSEQAPTPTCPAADGPAGAAEHWLAGWSTSPSDADIVRPIAEQTLRQVITPLHDGSEVRLRLQHRFGRTDAQVTDVVLGREGDWPALVPGSTCALTFDGEPTVTVPAGGEVVSDPVAFDVAALERLSIDLHVVGTIDQATRHFTAFEEPFGTVVGNASGEESGASFVGSIISPENSWLLLGGLDVVAPHTTGVIVAFGDSITDGFGNTTDAYCVCDPASTGTDTRYPDVLARRLLDAGLSFGVANAGIGGNELLKPGAQPQSGPAARDRYGRDVLDVPGATHVIVLIGTNDIGNNPDSDPDELIEAYDAMVRDLRQQGLHVTIGTITPARGTVVGDNPFGVGILHGTEASNAKRLVVNEWIRTGDVADAVVDFDACLRDPADPDRLLPAYDSGDHLHPNAAGYEAMADCLDLAVFGASGSTTAPAAEAPATGDAPRTAATGADGGLPSTGGGGATSAAILALGATALRRRRTAA